MKESRFKIWREYKVIKKLKLVNKGSFCIMTYKDKKCFFIPENFRATIFEVFVA